MDILFQFRPKKVNQTDLRYQIRDDEIYGPNSKLKYRGRIVNRRNPLPNELFTFYHLQVLDLSSKGTESEISLLEYLPIELFRLRNLKVLNIDFHNIRKLPNEIGGLMKLEILTLTRNKLAKLPVTFSSLVSLKYLHIASNCFEQFPEVINIFLNFTYHSFKLSLFFKVICKLKKLTYLDMSCNRLKNIPNDINHLIELDTLILNDNQIENLPSNLADCSNLRTLYLAFNKIKRLPNNFFYLKNLDWNQNGPLAINCLNGNPIEYPKIESKGLNEIFKILKENSSDCIVCHTSSDNNDDQLHNNGYAPANSVDLSLNHEIRIPNALIIDDLDDDY